jgi:hypothetical protein
VPAGAASYRLALTTARTSEEWRWATRTETVWSFRSSTTASAQKLPLLRIDYDVPADLSGYVSGRHRVGLSASGGRIAGAEVSFDEGRTWRPVSVTAGKAAIPASTGSVSLRVHAVGAGGVAVTQTVIRAYGASR